MNWVRATLAGFLICLSLSVSALTVEVLDLMVRIPDMIDRQLNQTRSDLTNQVELSRNALVDQLSRAEADLSRQLAMANGQIGQAAEKVDNQLANTNSAIVLAVNTYNDTAKDAIDRALSQTAPITANLEAITAQINEQEPMLNSRALAVSGETMKLLDASRLSANAIAKAMPQLTGDVTGITGYIAGFTKPKPPQGFFGRLKSHIGTAALIGAKVFLMK